MEDSFYFIFAYLFLSFLMYFVFWKPDANCQICLIIFGVIGFIGGGIWIGLYLGIFDPYLKYEYTMARDCEVSNFKMADLDGTEKYAVLTMRFSHPNTGESIYGHACASSEKYTNLA